MNELGNKVKAVAEEGLGRQYPLWGSAQCPCGLGQPSVPVDLPPGCGCTGLGVGITGGPDGTARLAL